MTPAAFHFEPLVGQHDRKSFRCGEDALDRYLQTQATQDIPAEHRQLFRRG